MARLFGLLSGVAHLTSAGLVVGCAAATRAPSGCAPASAPTGDTTVYDTLALTNQPKRTQFPAPNYPRRLLEAGIEGGVVMEFILDARGRVERSSVKVLARTHQEFVSSSVNVVRRAAFCPGLINGRPVRVRLTMPLRYVIPGLRYQASGTMLKAPSADRLALALIAPPPRR